MNLLIVHLSDIHIRNNTDPVLKRAELIAKATYKDLPLANAVVILVTGDIAFSGKASEYAAATTFFKQIEQNIRSEQDIPIYFVTCPGNHDCDFTSGNPDVRNVVVDSVRKTGTDALTEGLINECTSVQANFVEFRVNLANAAVINEHKLWTSYQITAGDTSIVFHCINVAWMSKQEEQPGLIVFPIKLFEDFLTGTADVSIACLHHPMNWFSQSSYRAFKKQVRKHSHLILTGHEHVSSVAAIDDTDSGESVAIDGGVLQEHNAPESQFNTIFLDLEKQEYSCSFYRWEGTMYAPAELESAWSSFRRLPSKRKSRFVLTDAFAQQLRNPGARFAHRDKADLTLDDIYIYPELRPLDQGEKGRAVVDAAIFRNPEQLIKKGVLIRGGEQYGKTSLLRQLFASYHDRGFVPVYLRGLDLTNSTERELQKAIEAAVTRQYGEDAHTRFWQLKAAQRVLLLDDLDEFSFAVRYLERVLQFLLKTFELRVIACDEVLELRELVQAEQFASLKSLEHYRLTEFGFRRRLDLVRKWVSLGDSAATSASLLMGQIDQAEKLLANVVGENVVPSTPFFLITLLQSSEAGGTNNLQHSAMAGYYYYLIIRSLHRQNVPQDEHHEILNYCANLGWFVFEARGRHITESEFSQFHQAFVARHALAVKFEKRKRLLLDTRLLECQDGAYAFSYLYLQYYFLGQYLADHLDEAEIQAVIRQCCAKLHVRENGNIVLFLAHHSRDKRVYESVLSVLRQQFNQHSPMMLEDDVKVVNDLVQSAPQLIYEERDVMETRKQVREAQDKATEAQEAVRENSEELPANIAAIISLLKTIEILGQFLKNHYGQLEATVKHELLKELFDGGLRGMRDLFLSLSADSVGLVQLIESALEKRGIESNQVRRNKRAKQLMFGLLSFFGFAFIRKCAVAVGSPHLSTAVNQVVESTHKTAYRLISAAIEMDQQGGFDSFVEIKRLNEELSGNAFAQSILQRMALLHIHMFETTSTQKQQVCAELKIDMQQQLAIDLKTRGSKKLKG